MVSLTIFLKNNINLESLVIAIAGYLIVFTALVLLFWFFNLVPKLIAMARANRRPAHEKTSSKKDGVTVSGEETAAIAMALHLYLDEVHDRESGILTIKRISSNYSPWSSKIYAVRNQFNRL